MSWLSATVTVACGFLLCFESYFWCLLLPNVLARWSFVEIASPFEAVDEEGFFVDDEDVDDFFEDSAGCEVECKTGRVVFFTVLKRSSLK